VSQSFGCITANQDVIYPRYDPAKFVGREWLVDEVAQFRDSPDRRHLVIVGEPGSGKSAFVAYLAETWNSPRHFIRGDNLSGVTGVDSRAFLLSIGTQLFQKYGTEIFDQGETQKTRMGIGVIGGQAEVTGQVIDELISPLPFLKGGERLVEVKVGVAAGQSRVIGERIRRLVDHSLSLKPSTLLHLAVLQPLFRLNELYPDEKVVMLIDALDETLHHLGESILDVIPNPADGYFPPNLRIVMTSRPGKALDRFQVKDQLRLNDRRAGYWNETLQDARAYIEQRMKEDIPVGKSDPIVKVELARFVTELVKKSEGNFLYLYHFLNTVSDVLKSGEIDLAKIPIPESLDEIYRFFALERIREYTPDIIRFSLEEDIAPEILQQLRVIQGIDGVEVVNHHVTLAVQNSDTVLNALLALAAQSGLMVKNLETKPGPELGNWEEKMLPVLGILAVAFDALSREQLADFSAVEVIYVDSILARLRQFLDVAQVDGKNHFRIYHASFAEYLLDGHRNRDFPLDQNHFHNKIVTFYLARMGKWEDASWGTEYPFRNLTSHLLAAGYREELHELVAPNRDRNPWAEAHYKNIGVYSWYLNDLEIAHLQAQQQGEKQADRLVRYALIHSSICSAADALTVEMLPTFLEASLLSPQAALADIAHKPKKTDKAAALASIAPFLPTNLIIEALQVVRTISEEEERSRALISLVEALPRPWDKESLQEALSIARELTNNRQCVNTLSQLVGLLPSAWQTEVAREALTAATDIRTSDGYLTDKDFVHAASNLPVALRWEALAIASQVADDWDRSRLLSGLMKLMPEEGQKKILDGIRSIKNPGARAYALSKLVADLPEKIRLRIIHESLRAVGKTKNNFLKAEVFSALAANCDRREKIKMAQEALKAGVKIDDGYLRAETLITLIDLLPEELKDTAVRGASSAAAQLEETDRIRVLTHLAQSAPASWKEPTARQAFQAVWGHFDDFWFDSQFARISAYLPETLLAQALDQVSTIPLEDNRQKALIALVKRLPVGLFEKALTVVENTEDEQERSGLFRDLAPCVPDPLKARTLAGISKIKDDFWRGYALSVLIPYLADECIPQVMEMAHNITEHAEMRAEVLIELIQLLPEPQSHEYIQEVLGIARDASLSFRRRDILYHLAITTSGSTRVQVLREALDAGREIGDEVLLPDVLKSIISRVSPATKLEIIDEALAFIRSIHRELFRTRAIRIFVQELPPGLSETAGKKVLEAIDHTEIHFVNDRNQILGELVGHLPDRQAEELFARAEKIVAEEQKVDLIKKMAPHLPDRLHLRLMEVVLGIGSEFFRIQALEGTIPYLPETVIPAVATQARNLVSDSDKAKVITLLAKYAPASQKGELLDEAHDLAWDLPEGYFRASALNELLCLLHGAQKKDACQEVLGCMQVFFDWQRDKVIANIVENLDASMEESKVSAALSFVREITEPNVRARLLCKLSHVLPEEQIEAVIREVLETSLKNAKYPHLYHQSLAEIAGGISEQYQGLVFEAAQAINRSSDRSTVMRQLTAKVGVSLKPAFARAAWTAALETGGPFFAPQALGDLAPFTPEALIDELWDAVFVIKEEEGRKFALSRIVPYLPEPERTEKLLEALDVIKGIKWSEWRTIAYCDLVPHFPQHEKADAIRQAFQAINATPSFRAEERASYFERLISTWLEPGVYEGQLAFDVLGETLHTIGTYGRNDFLVSLAGLTALIEKLDGTKAIKDCMAGIRQVTSSWFR
jgi:hypothetical protein